MIYGNITYATLTGGTTQDAYQVRLGYEIISEDMATNKRQVKLQLEVRSIKSAYGTYGFTQITTIDNVALSSKTFDMRSTNTWQIFGNRTITIEGAYSGIKNASFETNATTSSGVYALKRGSAEVAINLKPLHKAPEISYILSETNSSLTGVVSTNWILGLSKKRYTISTVTYDDATITSYAIYQDETLKVQSTSNIIDIDTSNISLTIKDDLLPITIQVVDSLGGTGTIDLYYNTYTQYFVPSFVANATTVKRNGQTSGKVVLNAQANFYNGNIGSVSNSVTIKYKYWSKNDTEPSEYITIPNSSINISGNNITITNYQLGTDFSYLNSYNVKLAINDTYSVAQLLSKNVLVGKAVWSEYKDRVDFTKITQNGEEIVTKTAILMGEEFETGNTINGNKEYRLYKNLGTLTNSESKVFNTDLQNTYIITNYKLYAKNRSSTQCISLPFISLNFQQYCSGYMDDANTVPTNTNTNMSGYDLIIDITYTKN